MCSKWLDKIYVISLICGILKKKYTNKLIYKTEVESQMKNTTLWLPRGRGGGAWDWLMHVYACSVMSNSATPWFRGSSVHRIFQARILEWVAISSSRGYSRPRDWTHVSYIGRWILYQWVTREARKIQHQLWKVWSNRLKCIDFDSLAVNRHWVKKKERFLT